MKKIIILTAAMVLATAGAALAADGKELWDKSCASCHGADGAGQTKMGQKYGVKDLTDAKVQADLTDDKALKAIKEGVTDADGKAKMKPFADKVTDDEAKALVAYIRTLKK
jgi:mono/diheme cytochrome c family protein